MEKNEQTDLIDSYTTGEVTHHGQDEARMVDRVQRVVLGQEDQEGRLSTAGDVHGKGNALFVGSRARHVVQLAIRGAGTESIANDRRVQRSGLVDADVQRSGQQTNLKTRQGILAVENRCEGWVRGFTATVVEAESDDEVTSGSGAVR